jgi:hypothetical protein
VGTNEQEQGVGKSRGRKMSKIRKERKRGLEQDSERYFLSTISRISRKSGMWASAASKKRIC